MRKASGWRWVVLLGVLSCFLVSGRVAAQEEPAPAADSDVQKRASEHFRRGVELFQEGAYRAAIVEFNRAYDIAPNFRLRYNIAQTQIQLLNYLGAVQSYEAYLSEGGAEVPAERREEVETALHALRERIGRISIGVSAPNAEIFVDEVKVGVSPLDTTVPVNVGQHRVHARTADGAEGSKVLEVAGGDLLEVKLELKKAPAQAVKTVVVARGPEGLSTYDKYAVACLAVGVVAAGGAVYFGLTASSDKDELDKALKARPNDAGKVADLRDSTKLYARMTDATAGVAVLALAASVTLWVLDDDDDDEEKGKAADTQLSVGPGGLTVTGRF
jgi:tetratricopeptide (TPR) repeat protein